MAMDKTTTRRMIGAIVLVLVAALVLAYLLKSKNNQPEINKVQDVTLPSSPILEFPGDGSASGTAATADGNTDQKVGLGVRPDGLSPAGDAVSDAAQANQTVADNNSGVGRKVVGGASSAPQQGSQTADSGKSSSQNAGSSQSKSADKSSSKLKEADILSLDSGSKVSSNKDKSSKKDEDKKKSASKPRLVGEKKLPKHSDKPRKPVKEEKEKKELAKKAASDAVPTTGFSIQLLATGSESKANAVKAQMVGEGYPAYTTSVIKDGKTLYRVRVGAYQGRDEADSVQARMKRRYTKNSNVQNSLVVAN